MRTSLLVGLLSLLVGAMFLAPQGSALPLGHGSHQGYLGINFHDLSQEQIASRKSRGVEVTVVDHDGPACRSGLKEHDIILQMDGHAIESEEQLRHMLHEIPAGRTVAFLIERDGQQQTFSVQLANRETVGQEAWERHMTVPEPAWHENGLLNEKTPAEDVPHHSFLGTAILNSSYTGAMLEMMSPQLADFFGATGGLLVRSVDPDSPAAIAGLRAGDVVIRVDATLMESTGDWTKIIRDGHGKALSVVILRDRREQVLTLKPDGRKRSGVMLHLWPGALPAAMLPVALPWMGRSSLWSFGL
ncbi:MAG TPA: PDZ domain-containing protein [Granulicella sp.]